MRWELATFAERNTLYLMPFRYRLLGFLPLCFFIGHLRYHLLYNTPENMLWMCNFSNLLLAAGFFLDLPVLIRVAFVWGIPAVPLWIIDMLHTGDYPVSTFFSHLGGFAVGVLAMGKVRSQRWLWIYAFVYAIVLQQVSRWITPPSLNVNVAFRPYYGWESTFAVYWQWWLFIAVVAGTALWLMGLLLWRIFPPQAEQDP
jgi:hypothetical protein